jgi:hypothetical protein
MTSGSMRYWLRPTLGAVLFIAGAAGVSYKVISGYRHAAPDAFISVQDQNKMAAASAAKFTAEASAVAVDAGATSPKSMATAVSTTTAAPAAPAPAPAPRGALRRASGVADADLTADAQNDSACVAIETEQHEIEGALNKKYSSEEGRYMQRRLRELTEQSVKHKCGE